MSWVLEQTSGPDIEPVSLAEVRRHLRCYDDQTDDDDDITMLIQAGREWAESATGRALVDQTWRLSIRSTGRGGDDISIYRRAYGYVCGDVSWTQVGEILMRRSPVLSIESFVTVDADGTTTAVDADTYELREVDSKWPRLVALTGATWATATDIRISFRAGYADRSGGSPETASVVPGCFKHAIKLWVEAHYDRDADADHLMNMARMLIKPENALHGFA